MAAAGVSYVVGREPNALYGETRNGVHPNFNRPDFPKKISPDDLVLVPSIGSTKDLVEGEGDSLVQAYNYRLCLTDIPENTVRIEKPNDYDEKEYELLFRIIAATPKETSIF